MKDSIIPETALPLNLCTLYLKTAESLLSRKCIKQVFAKVNVQKKKEFVNKVKIGRTLSILSVL